ncbi:MAG: hypothetical protein EZS28_052460, partial [Streblomastix strix]
MQLERNSGRSLRVTPFSTFLERAAGTVVKDRNRQQFYCVQSEQRSCSNLSTETDRQNIGSGRGHGASNPRIPHPWKGEYDSRFSFQTCVIGRLFPQRGNPTRGIDNVKDKTIDRHVLQSSQQKVQEICQPVAGQMGGSPRLSLNIIATRGTLSTPAYSSDTANSKQINGREGTGSDDTTILAVSTVVAGTHEDGIKIDYPRRKRRRLSPGRQDEEAKEAPTTRKNDGCLVRGNRGEELFRWVLSQRGLTSTAIQNVINGWHE